MCTFNYHSFPQKYILNILLYWKDIMKLCLALSFFFFFFYLQSIKRQNYFVGVTITIHTGTSRIEHTQILRMKSHWKRSIRKLQDITKQSNITFSISARLFYFSWHLDDLSVRQIKLYQTHNKHLVFSHHFIFLLCKKFIEGH